MKVLYVNEDRHDNILRAFANPKNENIYAIPYNLDNIAPGKQYILSAFQDLYPNNRYNVKLRYKLAQEIRKVAEIERPDIIHFVSADEYLKFFGMSLEILRSYRIVLTFHWCPRSRMRDLSRKIIAKKVDQIIFHVIDAPEYTGKNGVINSKFIILPPEHTGLIYDKYLSKKALGIENNYKTISFVGSMEIYKGIEILLKALREIQTPFNLVLGGNLRTYNEEFIRKLFSTYKESVYFYPGFMTDEMFMKSICAADYVVIPYRKSFEATSGPMTEAIRCNIPIIATNYGNIGNLTKKYELGYTFEAENVDSLTEVLQHALVNDFDISDSFKQYKSNLSVEKYRESQQEVYCAALTAKVKGN